MTRRARLTWRFWIHRFPRFHAIEWRSARVVALVVVVLLAISEEALAELPFRIPRPLTIRPVGMRVPLIPNYESVIAEARTAGNAYGHVSTEIADSLDGLHRSAVRQVNNDSTPSR